MDEIGRAKTEKEAFRDLSHRFHGKGSGKMKQEKRAKRLQEVIFDINLIIKELKLYFGLIYTILASNHMINIRMINMIQDQLYDRR